MSILEILEYPDPRLRKKAMPVNQFGDVLQKQIDELTAGSAIFPAPSIPPYANLLTDQHA